MEQVIIAILAFVGVVALVMTVFMFSTPQPNKKIENRLDVIAGKVTKEETLKADIIRKTIAESDKDSLIQRFLPKSISLN
ncbi:MAG: hypothetical protein ACO3F3_13355, partial [Gemmataceae bacterium]